MSEIRPQPRPVRELDPDYLAFVRSKPCCLIGYEWRSGAMRMLHVCKGEIEAHHVSPRDGTKGTGSKVSDRRAVPVCFQGHRTAEKLASELLQFFNRTIQSLNREYDATHPNKEKRERKPSVKVGLGVRNCPACRGEHFYPTREFRGVTGYQCKVKNVWVDLQEIE